VQVREQSCMCMYDAGIFFDSPLFCMKQGGRVWWTCLLCQLQCLKFFTIPGR
jgi:hypothetical protein